MGFPDSRDPIATAGRDPSDRYYAELLGQGGGRVTGIHLAAPAVDLTREGFAVTGASGHSTDRTRSRIGRSFIAAST